MPDLDDIRTSYDTVAADYADQLRDALDGLPFLRGALAILADEVRLAGGGPVADLGCGPGHLTAHLRDLGVDAFGIDLSPTMIEVARREHPGVRFEVGTMTALPLPDAGLAGVLSSWSTVHLPDEALPTVFAEFHRVLRPGATVHVGFHAGTGTTLKTEGYGGHPMHVHVHRRQPDQLATWLREAGFVITAQLLLDPDERPGAIVCGRKAG